MKELLPINLFLLLSIMIISCTSSETFSGETIHYLNPVDEPLDEVLPYTKVKVINLESTLSCLLGNIKRIEMNDSCIFVSEYDKLYIFTQDGKFVSKVGNKGEGPDEYIVLSSFYIDNAKQQVVIIDNFKNILIKYDFTGKYNSTVAVPKNAFESCNYTLLTANDKLLSYNMMSMNDREAYSLYDLNKEVSKQLFSYHPITIGNYMYPFSWHPMTKVGEDINLIMPLCDTIYTYLPEKSVCEPKYVVETPAKMASRSQIRKKTPDYLEDICYLADEGYFTGFTGIFETSKKGLLEYRQQGVVVGYFLFDKETKTGNYYLGAPSSSETGILPFYPIIYSYQNAFVGYADAGNLLKIKDDIKDAKIRECIETLKEDDNPCLIIYEFE